MPFGNKLVILVLILCNTAHSVQSTRRSISSSSTVNSEHFALLWIDDNIEEYANDNDETRQLFRQLFSTIEFESDLDDAMQVINRIKYTNKHLLIVVSGQKTSLLFQYLTHYSLNDDIRAIFVFCQNLDAYTYLKHDKLFGIFTDRNFLVESIRTVMFITLRDTLKTSTNLLDQQQTWSRTVPAVTTTQMWYQLYLEVLQILPRDEQAKQEMLKKSQEYYADEAAELRQINDFRISYSSAMAIEWYTEDSFVHKLVNKALRSERIELISAFRFFIGDLSAAIKKEYINQQKIFGTIASKFKAGSSSILKVYSGQVLPRTELQRLEQQLGTVIAINGFFSTSLQLTKARVFTNRELFQYNMQQVFIEISFDTSVQNITAFAEISSRSRYSSEAEVVFDYGALFNITSVQYDSSTDIWSVQMTAASRTSIREHPYLATIRETFIQNHSNMVAYGIILAHGFQRRDEAIQYFTRLLLNCSSDHTDIPDILQQRGTLYEHNGEHVLAFDEYNKALKIRRARVQENLQGMARLYGHIGTLQTTTSDFQASLNSHQEAMKIYDQLYTKDTDHVAKAKVNENIGLTYLKVGNLTEALEYLTSAKSTYQRLLSEKHLFAVEILGHLGTVYETTDDLRLAMKLFHRQLNQSEEILPLDHQLLITSLNAIVRIQIKINQTSNISVVLNEHLQKLNKTLGKHHSSLPFVINMLASLLEVSEPIEAIHLYNRILQMDQKSQQSHRSLMSKSHRKLAELYKKVANPTQALDHAIQALKIQQELSFEQDSRSVEAHDLHTIGLIYLEMKLSIDALPYLTKSLIIYQSIYASDHPVVQAVLTDIAQAVNQSRVNT